MPTVPPWQLVQGWLTPAEGAALQALAQDKHVLEIGCWKGRSTVAMLATASTMWCLDHWQGDAYAGRGWFLPEFMDNVRPHVLGDARLRVFMGPCEELLPVLDTRTVQVVFYDADHDEGPTYFALEHLVRRTAPGAVFAVHDYGHPHSPAVKSVVDAFANRHGYALRAVDQLAVLEPVL